MPPEIEEVHDVKKLYEDLGTALWALGSATTHNAMAQMALVTMLRGYDVLARALDLRVDGEKEDGNPVALKVASELEKVARMALD